MTEPALSRRRFLQATAGTALLVVTPIGAALVASAAPPDPLAGGTAWQGPPGHARWRIDGVAKVTGQKVFARDLRARDMAGWPAEERMALVLRATRTDRPYLRPNLALLPPEAQPMRVVDSQALARDRVTFGGAAEMTPLIAQVGQAPGYLGQPVAILLFRDLAAWRKAARLLQFAPDAVIYGEEPAQPVPPTLYAPPTYLIRKAGPDGDIFSQVKDGYADPTQCSTGSPVNCEALRVQNEILADIALQPWRRYAQRYTTQSIDPVFMEPESGLAWFDRSGTGTLHLVLGTQSPNGDVGTVTGLFAQSPQRVGTVHLHSCYTGGGFGGRDVSNFALLMAIAGYYAEGPVRLAFDRFEQFQAGLKRHSGVLAQTVCVDAEGKFRALHADYAFDGGGQANYSPWVAQLAGICAGGAYAFPESVVASYAQRSIDVTAGSMRGFGGPQAFFALESLVDEIAADLKVDPIELRLRNVQTEGGRTVTGAPLLQPPRLDEICRRAQAHPLWAKRAAAKAARGADTLYGVGFALSFLAYGTGTDGVLAGAEIDAEGRLHVTTSAVDMGNGSATTLAIVPARWMGANADGVSMGETAIWSALALAQGSYTAPPPPGMQNTPAISMSSSACITAFQQVHAVEQAARVLFETGMMAAARRLWGRPELPAAATAWRDGALTADGLPPLPRAALAAEAVRAGLVTRVLVHALFQTEWVTAGFQVDGQSARWPIDALAVARGGAPGYTVVPRSDLALPPANAGLWGRSAYAGSGCLAAVEVDRRTRRIRVVGLHGLLDAGRIHQEQLVRGQFEGGVAMGIGYALLEHLPPLAEGPGKGDWNLDRYHVAMARDMPLGALSLDILPPLAGDSPGKGIAEAVLCPVAPAIANAVADATGQRVRSLPITPDKLAQLS
ncbi:MAG TPA: molybdopterin cofactor-binding domain-containing protein [Alphaproteobacteria bacterium]|nr:molybdopterin cofactor-binding domain-containing protein [Alphaproteobacteria bacterium]